MSWSKGSELEQAGRLERAGSVLRGWSELEQGERAGRLERAGSRLE